MEVSFLFLCRMDEELEAFRIAGAAMWRSVLLEERRIQLICKPKRHRVILC